MVELADVIIVHNDVMKKWFMDRGIDSEKLITLEVFDYLQEEQKKQVYFERSITIAGNLDTTKCGYIGMLGELNNIKIIINIKTIEIKRNLPINCLYQQP